MNFELETPCTTILGALHNFLLETPQMTTVVSCIQPITGSFSHKSITSVNANTRFGRRTAIQGVRHLHQTQTSWVMHASLGISPKMGIQLTGSPDLDGLQDFA